MICDLDLLLHHGTRCAKLLCSLTSRASSSSFVYVTACDLLLLMGTPISVRTPVMMATIMPHYLEMLSLRLRLNSANSASLSTSGTAVMSALHMRRLTIMQRSISSVTLRPRSSP